MIKKTEEEIALQTHADALWAEYIAVGERIKDLEAESNELYAAHKIAEEKLEVFHEERWAAWRREQSEADRKFIVSNLIN